MHFDFISSHERVNFRVFRKAHQHLHKNEITHNKMRIKKKALFHYVHHYVTKLTSERTQHVKKMKNLT